MPKIWTKKMRTQHVDVGQRATYAWISKNPEGSLTVNFFE